MPVQIILHAVLMVARLRVTAVQVWYVPEKSAVMSVKAYEIVKGEAFQPAGLTLRFPRCTSIRDDKRWDESERFEDVQRRWKEGKAKVAASKRSAADVAKTEEDRPEHAGNKHSKRSSTNTRKVAVLSYLVHDAHAIAEVQQKLQVLHGKVRSRIRFSVANASLCIRISSQALS